MSLTLQCTATTRAEEKSEEKAAFTQSASRDRRALDPYNRGTREREVSGGVGMGK